MAFLDVDFPRGIARGSQRMMERRVDIVSLGSGYEETNARWADSRRSWQTGLGVRSADDLAAVTALFEEAGGPEHSFRFRDWADYQSCLPSVTPSATDQVIGTGDGVMLAFQLVKTYGVLNTYSRAITLPLSGSVRVAVDGSEQAAGWSVDPFSGIVAFTVPPAVGEVVTAGFEFDVPVRFGSNTLAVELTYFDDFGGTGIGSVPDILLVEKRADNPDLITAPAPVSGGGPSVSGGFSSGFSSGFG